MPSPHHAHMPQGDLASPHPLSLPPTPSPDDFTDLSDVSAFASSELDEYDFLLHDSLSSAPASEPFSPLRLPASPVSPAASAPASASVFAASSSESLLLSGVDLDSLKSRRTPNERFPDAGQAAEAVTSQTNTNPAELASTPDPASKDTSPPSAAAHAHNVSDTRELSRSCDMHDSTMTDVLFFPQHRAGFFSPTSSTLELEESWCHASAMHTPQHPFSSTYPTDSVRLTRPWNLRRSVLDEPAPDSSHDVTSISASTIAPESVAHQDSRNVHPLSVRALAHIFTSDRNVRNTLQPAISEIQASLTKAYPSSKIFLDLSWGLFPEHLPAGSPAGTRSRGAQFLLVPLDGTSSTDLARTLASYVKNKLSLDAEAAGGLPHESSLVLPVKLPANESNSMGSLPSSASTGLRGLWELIGLANAAPEYVHWTDTVNQMQALSEENPMFRGLLSNLKRLKPVGKGLERILRLGDFANEIKLAHDGRSDWAGLYAGLSPDFCPVDNNDFTGAPQSTQRERLYYTQDDAQDEVAAARGPPTLQCRHQDTTSPADPFPSNHSSVTAPYRPTPSTSEAKHELEQVPDGSDQITKGLRESNPPSSHVTQFKSEALLPALEPPQTRSIRHVGIGASLLIFLPLMALILHLDLSSKSIPGQFSLSRLFSGGSWSKQDSANVLMNFDAFRPDRDQMASEDSTTWSAPNGKQMNVTIDTWTSVPPASCRRSSTSVPASTPSALCASGVHSPDGYAFNLQTSSAHALGRYNACRDQEEKGLVEVSRRAAHGQESAPAATLSGPEAMELDRPHAGSQTATAERTEESNAFFDAHQYFAPFPTSLRSSHSSLLALESKPNQAVLSDLETNFLRLWNDLTRWGTELAQLLEMWLRIIREDSAALRDSMPDFSYLSECKRGAFSDVPWKRFSPNLKQNFPYDSESWTRAKTNVAGTITLAQEQARRLTQQVKTMVYRTTRRSARGALFAQSKAQREIQTSLESIQQTLDASNAAIRRAVHLPDFRTRTSNENKVKIKAGQQGTKVGSPDLVLQAWDETYAKLQHTLDQLWKQSRLQHSHAQRSAAKLASRLRSRASRFLPDSGSSHFPWRSMNRPSVNRLPTTSLGELRELLTNTRSRSRFPWAGKLFRNFGPPSRHADLSSRFRGNSPSWASLSVQEMRRRLHARR